MIEEIGKLRERLKTFFIPGALVPLCALKKSTIISVFFICSKTTSCLSKTNLKNEGMF
ncbi:hypothetical protein [Peribacillus simplex]|uniref:hypothetical protein n=1 Tax=Peribacillus simplex TaxID=1478 RepID=UPI000ACB41DC|nr:hypothetical protein [Peribacillus simplex]